MDEQTLNYRGNEFLAVCPFPVDFDKDTFKIQIKSDDGKSTKWLNITGEEFHNIDLLLSGMKPNW